MKQRIPMTALQTAIYTALVNHQTTPVYDDLPIGKYDEDGKQIFDDEGNPVPVDFPLITFGAFTWKTNSAKGLAAGDVSLQIQVFSEYNGKKEVNEIMDDVTEVLSSVKLDLSASGFKVLNLEVDFVEAFPEEEDDGYRGVITVVGRIQDMGGK